MEKLTSNIGSIDAPRTAVWLSICVSEAMQLTMWQWCEHLDTCRTGKQVHSCSCGGPRYILLNSLWRVHATNEWRDVDLQTTVKYQPIFLTLKHWYLVTASSAVITQRLGRSTNSFQQRFTGTGWQWQQRVWTISGTTQQLLLIHRRQKATANKHIINLRTSALTLL